MLYRKYMKRFCDVVGAAILLILLAPLLIFVGLLVGIKLGSPIIYVQQRPGLNEKIFVLYKFRTMREAKNLNGEDLPDEARLSNFGRKLRSTSIDELPELINILRGDMSFVGPRPLLVEYLPLYSEAHSKRHCVRPGLTGYAQVNGRNTLSWAEKFDLDIEYVSKYNLLLDIKILLMTISSVIRRQGVCPDDTETMESFKGYGK